MCVCERERGREGGRYRPNIGGIMCVCVCLTTRAY